MRVLISGANGFIGKALTRYLLAEGVEVIALVTDLSDMKDLTCDSLTVLPLFFPEYRQLSSLFSGPVDICYHLAWAGLCGASAADVRLQLTNVEATYVLLEQLKLIGCKKFIMASTMNSLETRQLLDDPLSRLPRMATVHVASKINAELIARTFCNAWEIEFNAAIIAMAYGPGNRSKMVPNIVICNLLESIPTRLINGANQYDIIFIDDIVTALECIGRLGVARQSYYVGHAEARTFKEIFSEIGRILNPSVPLRFGEYPDDTSIDFSHLDRTSLTRDAGWMPSKGFRESVLITADWLSQSGGSSFLV